MQVLRSRFLLKFLEIFRQIEAKMYILLLYEVKPLWGILNTNFSRKFAPCISIDFNRGGSNLLNRVEKPAVDGGYRKL